MPLAALVLGSVATALPAAAAQNEAGTAPRTAAVAAPREELPRAKVERPLVMLVCREARGGRREAGTKAADLTCSTRWAGF